jgi:hypothetical protein
MLFVSFAICNTTSLKANFPLCPSFLVNGYSKTLNIFLNDWRREREKPCKSAEKAAM